MPVKGSIFFFTESGKSPASFGRVLSKKKDWPQAVKKGEMIMRQEAITMNPVRLGHVMHAKERVPKEKKSQHHYNSTVVKMTSIAAFLILWQLFCFYNAEAQVINPVFLPGPLDILRTMAEQIQDGSLVTNVSVSIYRILKGYFFGVLVAVVLGYFMAKVRVLNDILDPLLGVFGSIPPYAFCPLFIIWFGIGEESKTLLIAYTTLLPMIGYVIQGVRNVDPLLIRSARSLGANEFQTFRKIVVPSALPYLLNGMKTCLGLTFAALIVAEMMGASEGLGYIIVNARNWFLVSDMFLSLAMIAITYTIMKQIICFAEDKLLKWKKFEQKAIE